MKKIILILICLIFQNLTAQKITSEEERKNISEMIYEMNSEFFKNKKSKFKKVEYNPDKFFSKPFSIDEAESCFKLMQKTAKVEFKNKHLYLISDILPELNNSDLRSSLISINVYENNLFYDKDSLILRGYGGGNIISNDRYQITRSYPLKKEQSDSKKINGNLTMKIDFVIGYDLVSIKSDKFKNNKIKIGQDNIEIIDVLGDNVILKGKTEDVELINFVGSNKIAKPLTIGDKDYNSNEQLSFSSMTIYKDNYENIIVKKLKIEEFDKLMTIDRINNMQKGEKYKVLKNITRIGKKIILYKPKFKTYYLKVGI